MGKKKFLALFLASALAVAVVFGASTAASVYAQENTPTPAAPAEETQGPHALPPGEFKHGPGGPGVRSNEEDLASALGITGEELQTAEDAASAGALAQAVAAGELTQEQADAITAGGRPFHDLRSSSVDYDALLADTLGISVKQFEAARTQARSAALDRAVAAGVLTQEEADLIRAREALFTDDSFQSSMQSAFDTAVQQAVTDSVITQDQADQILAKNPGFGFGHSSGPGRRGGW